MTITIDKEEYMSLKRDATAYRRMASTFFKKAISTPVADTISDFRNSNLYTESFLNDLESGLLKSSLKPQT